MAGPGSAEGSSVGTQPPATPKPEITQTVRINLPDVFDGSRGKLGAYKQQCGLYLAFNDKQFSVVTLKVIWATSFLRGTAARWIEPILDDYFKNISTTKNVTTT